MRRALLVALAWLAGATAVVGQDLVYGPPKPPPLPDNYARAYVAAPGTPRAAFILWRPPEKSDTLLVVADDEPRLGALDRPDLLQIARARKMTILFSGAARGPLQSDLDLPAALAVARGAADKTAAGKVIGTGAEEMADVVRRLASVAPGTFDALLLVNARVAPPQKDEVFAIELITSDAYWRKTPRAPEAAKSAKTGRRYFIAGSLACDAPLADGAVEPARRAALVALDLWLHRGPAPPISREADLVAAKSLNWPKIPGAPAAVADERLVPRIDVDGNDASGLRMPDRALPRATFFGAGRGKEDCGSGGRFPFPASKTERDASGDPRLSLIERYGARSYYVAALRSVADKLVKERLLLPQDADAYVAEGKKAPF